jgi:hypothetical protein
VSIPYDGFFCWTDDLSICFPPALQGLHSCGLKSFVTVLLSAAYSNILVGILYPFMYHIIGTYWAFHDKDLIDLINVLTFIVVSTAINITSSKRATFFQLAFKHELIT